MKKIKCDCEDPGSITIDKDSEIYAGIKGLLELDNIKINNKKIICLGCGKIIYKEKK